MIVTAGMPKKQLDAYEAASGFYNASLDLLGSPGTLALPLRDSVEPAIGFVRNAVKLLEPFKAEVEAEASIRDAGSAVRLLNRYLKNDPIHNADDVKLLDRARTTILVADATLSYGP
jgi:hypothetical protein